MATPQRIMITGCAGFLAGYLHHTLKEKNSYRIFGLSDIPAPLFPGEDVFIQDIRDAQAVAATIQKIQPDIVFHLAAVTNVAASWLDPKLTYDVNFIGSQNILHALQQHCPNAKVILMGTAEIYDTSQNIPFHENLPLVCNNPYALSKRAMEMLGELYMQCSALQIIRIRSFNFTGPGQNAKFVASDFAKQIAEAELGLGPAAIHVGNLSARRDFSDVRDIARYLAEIGARGESGDVFNLCSGSGITIHEILNMLLSNARIALEIIQDSSKFRPLDTPSIVGDRSKLLEKLGLEPQIPLPQTLTDLLQNWRDRLHACASSS